MTFSHEGSPFSNNFRQFSSHDLQRRAFPMDGHLVDEGLLARGHGLVDLAQGRVVELGQRAAVSHNTFRQRSPRLRAAVQLVELARSRPVPRG